MRAAALALVLLTGCATGDGYHPPSHYRSDLGPLQSTNPAGRLPPMGVLKGKKGLVADAFRAAAYAQMAVQAAAAIGEIVDPAEDEDEVTKALMKERVPSVRR